MVNYNGALAGRTDPEDPAFPENLFKHARSKRSHYRPGMTCRGVELNVRLDELLRRAARQRGITFVGYMRRALTAFIAYDLGMEFEEVVTLNKQVVKPMSSGWKKLGPDDGHGFGQWRIESLGDTRE